MAKINRITAALRATSSSAWRETAEVEPPEVELPGADLDGEDEAENEPEEATAAPKRKRIRTPRAPYAPSQSRQKNAALVKIMGARLKEARELCNMSQSEAAARFGYANSSKLNKVENATDTLSVPIWLIVDAAQLYEVSTEYLFGLSDDWETGCHRGVTSFLQQQWDQQRARDLRALAVLNSRIVTALEVLPRLQAAADYAASSVEIVEKRNKNFDEMPGGARLQAAARQLKEAVAEAAKAQRHLHLQLPPELQQETEHA